MAANTGNSNSETARERQREKAGALDLHWMDQALELARAAERSGEVPIGAVVIGPEGELLGRGFNRTLLDLDPTAHAEVVALREAAWKAGNHRLNGAVVYATLEPCAMCAGALIQARIARLVYGAEDPKAGAIHSVLQLSNHPQLNHRFAVTAGLRGEESGALLRRFFEARRKTGGAAGQE